MALLELYSPLLKRPNNTFEARGLEKLLNFFFLVEFFLGSRRPSADRTTKKFNKKKVFQKIFRKQLDGASITIGAITGVGKNLRRGRGVR